MLIYTTPNAVIFSKYLHEASLFDHNEDWRQNNLYQKKNSIKKNCIKMIGASINGRQIDRCKNYLAPRLRNVGAKMTGVQNVRG